MSMREKLDVIIGCMDFADRIFGSIKIEDPLILDLINTPSFQRLKRINQYGGVNLIYPTHQVSRFEHSVGVWWILKSLHTSSEIRVAGLLHDIGHTAFSHMIEMAMKNKNEDLHEHTLKSKYDIKKILKKYNVKIIEPDLCPEIKRSSMDIGADRLDYGIRDYYGALGIKTRFGLEVLKNVRLKNRSIVFTSKLVARKYALTALKAMWKVIYDPKVAVVYQSLIEIIRVGLNDGWLNKKDLNQDDKYVFNKIKENRIKFSSLYLKIFERAFVAKEVNGNEKHDFYHVKLRSRYFDPLVLRKGRILNLSKFDKIYKQELDKYSMIFEKRKKGIGIKVNFR